VAVIVAGVVGASVWLNRTAPPSEGPAQAGGVSTASVGTTYPAPRADQWIYVKDVTVDTSVIDKDKGISSDPLTHEDWRRVDGTQMASYNDITGNLDTWDQTSDYPFLATLPTDPHAVVDAVRAYEQQLHQPPTSLPGGVAPPIAADGAQPTSDASLRGDITGFFQYYVLPPDVAAALWQALALLSGVTEEPAAVTFRGHDALAATWVDQGWQSVRFYVDPDTHAFVGSETTAIADYTFDTPTGPLTEKAGSALWSIERLAAGIVDKAGDTV
jgi:hypothetical protein